MAITQLHTACIKDGTIVNADIDSSAAIALGKLGTSGTAANTTFLRGDGAWSVISGVDISNLNANNLSTGTVPDARFPSTLPAASGANLTALNGSNIASGTIAAARLSTATTQSAGNNSTKIATTAYTDTAISNLVDSSPSALNTLNELAAALGDDANFSTTVTNSIATKLPLAGGTLSGDLNVGDNNITNVGVISVDKIQPDASNVLINMGTDKNVSFSGGIGEIGNVTGFQTTNDAQSANTSFGIRANDIRFATGNAERVRIDSTGVGIGTTGPEDKLHIKSGKLRIENAIVSNNDSTISYDNDVFLIDVDPNNVRGSSAFQVKVDTVAGLTIDDNRHVGLGITSPTAALHVVETASTTAVKVKSGTSTNQSTHISLYNDNDGGTLSLGVFGSSANTHGAITATDGFISSNQELVLVAQNSSGAIKFGVGSTPTERAKLDSQGKFWLDRTHTSATNGNHPALDIDTYANGTPATTFATGIDFRVAGVHKKRLAITNGSGTGGGDWIFYSDNGTNEALHMHKDGKFTVGGGDTNQGQWFFKNTASSGAAATGGDTGMQIASWMGRTEVDISGTDNYTLKISNQGYAGNGVSGDDGTIAKILFSGATSNAWGSNCAIGLDTVGTGGQKGELFFCTGDMNEKFRITRAGDFGTNGVTPSTQTGRVFHLHAGSHQQRFHMTNNTTGSGATDGFEIICEQSANTRIRNFEGGYMAFDSGGTNNEVFRITQNGDMGMSTSPSNYSNYKTFTIDHNSIGSILELRGATSNFKHLVQNNNGDMLFEADSQNAKNSTNMIFKLDGDQKLKIDQDGDTFFKSTRGSGANDQCNLMEQVNGVHSWGTVLRLHVTSANNDRPAICFSSGNGTQYNWLMGQTNAANDFRWNLAGGYGTGLWGTTKMHLYTNGNLSITGSYSSSDLRLKENIADITNAITKLKNLRGRTFTWQERAGHATGTQYGFIAQEIQPHIPELVQANGNHYFDNDDNIVYEDNETRAAGGARSLTINYGQVTPIIVEALKEALSKIELLETKVAALEGA